jgi:histidine triad (HIT) family protein
MAPECAFCRLVAAPEEVVFQDAATVAFLDHRPVFPGHTLVVPRAHHETLADLPADLVGPLFRTVQLVARAVEEALAADGTFVALNNKVSQSVPHLHVHVVPRKRKDGLRGFFWPRQKYESDDEVRAVAGRIREAAARLQTAGPR